MHQRHRIINFIVSFVVILSCAIVLAISFEVKNRTQPDDTPNIDPDDFVHIIIPNQPTPPSNTTPPDPPDQPEEPTPKPSTPFINLQPTVDTWLKSLAPTEKVGLLIYDITNNRIAASFNPNQVFQVASVYKLLFAYDGYQQLANGSDDPNQILVTTKDKGPLSISKCLDLIIRESYNGCADVMNRDSKRVARVNQLIQEFKLNNTSNIGLNSTATDITKLLLHYWRHSDLPKELWSQLSDSMLNQPPSRTSDSEIYDWRQGLPAGFSDQVKVYNKVGWNWNGKYWNIYADAAILDFVNLNHQYTAVILTQNLSSYNKITKLGQMIEAAVTVQTN